MFVPDDLFHTWLLVYNLTHFRTSTRQRRTKCTAEADGVIDVPWNGSVVVVLGRRAGALSFDDR